jgi:hypothetical protein
MATNLLAEASMSSIEQISAKDFFPSTMSSVDFTLREGSSSSSHSHRLGSEGVPHPRGYQVTTDHNRNAFLFPDFPDAFDVRVMSLLLH